MKIGVLQAGPVADELVEAHGEYDRVFRTFLRRADPSMDTIGWAVFDGDFPGAPDDADGWIISGSKHGVYEDHAWIPPLKDFVRDVVAARRPLIGVCFGHQIMAEALGGRVEKFSGGWGIGPHEYIAANGANRPPGAPDRLSLHAVHQDQVIIVPPDAEVLYASSFCANAALAYGDPNAPYALSIQPHPEFDDAFTRRLIECRRGAAFPEDASDAALSEIGEPTDSDWVARWFTNFLKR